MTLPHTSETRNGKLQAKVEAAEKWMEAIKAMEALASFSRRKIRNWEGIHAAKPGVTKVCLNALLPICFLKGAQVHDLSEEKGFLNALLTECPNPDPSPTPTPSPPCHLLLSSVSPSFTTCAACGFLCMQPRKANAHA